jgi:hypothetical protein
MKAMAAITQSRGCKFLTKSMWNLLLLYYRYNTPTLVVQGWRLSRCIRPLVAAGMGGGSARSQVIREWEERK